jgi:hypothetical protein
LECQDAHRSGGCKRNFAHPPVKTVAELAAQDPVTVTPLMHIGSGTPRLALEKVVYRVRVRLVKAKIEGGCSGDEDIHLVIAGVGFFDLNTEHHSSDARRATANFTPYSSS